jgi:9beta-pimara-7,15-diene oxidase
MLSATALLLFLLLLVSVIALLVSSNHGNHNTGTKSKKKRPPGPWRLPFIGSIHHLLTSQPQATLRDLAQKHGPVMYLRLGQVDTVVVSSPAVAQVVLRDKDINFASRPYPYLLATEIIGYGGHGFALAPYGAYWRALRKLCMLELLSARKVRQLAPIRDNETMSLVREIRHRSCANYITGLATFGDRFSSEHKAKFLSVMAVVLSSGSGFCVSDLFPSMRFLDVATGMRRRLQVAHEQLDQVLDQIIEACEARQKVKNAEAAEDDDIVSTMLRIKDEEEFDFPFNITHIKAVIIVSVLLRSDPFEWNLINQR